MGKFHRYRQPTYAGAPALPAGPSVITFNGTDYNLFNVVSEGTGASGSAFMDDAKASGPNAGTYGVAFGEDATSANTNRGFRALAENTDVLDDLMNRDIALPVRTGLTTLASPLGAITVPSGTYVGNTVSYPLDMLFQITDDHDREILNAAKTDSIKVISVSGATVGSGFSSGAILLSLSEPLQAGTTFRLYYSTRSSLAAMPSDALSFINVRGAQEVSAEVESVFYSIQSPSAVGLSWNATPTSTLWDLARSGLNERYNRSTTADALASVPSYHPGVTLDFNTEGSGSWYKRGDSSYSGPGFTGYSQIDVTDWVGTRGYAEHALGGMWNVVLEDNIQIDIASPFKSTFRASMSSGFVFLGGKNPGDVDQLSGNTGISAPGMFSFYAGARRAPASNASPRRTKITPGSVGTITGLNSGYPILELASGDYARDGSLQTSFALRTDLLHVRVNGEEYYVVGWSFDSPTALRLSFLDCAQPNFPVGASVTILEWIQTGSYVSDGGAYAGSYGISRALTSRLHGMFHAAPPADEDSSTALASQFECARFFGGDPNNPLFPNRAAAVYWGGFDPSLGFYVGKGTLRADGGADFQGLVTFDVAPAMPAGFDTPHIDTDTSGTTLTGNIAITGTIVGDVTFNATYTNAQYERSISTVSASPTIDVDDRPNVYWDITSASPSTNTVTLAATGVDIDSVTYTTKFTVWVIRRPGASTLVNKVNFTVASDTAVNIPVLRYSGDFELQPITDAAVTYIDRYDAQVMNIPSVGWRAVFEVTRYNPE